ncbi:MAG: hypothetical protein ABF463_00170 [Ethanoligenens sp.]
MFVVLPGAKDELGLPTVVLLAALGNCVGPVETAVTVTTQVSRCPSGFVARMYVVPVLTALTLPLLSTVATALLVDVHASVLSVAVVGVMLAVSCTVSLGCKVRLAWLKSMDVTGIVDNAAAAFGAAPLGAGAALTTGILTVSLVLLEETVGPELLELIPKLDDTTASILNRLFAAVAEEPILLTAIAETTTAATTQPPIPK